MSTTIEDVSIIGRQLKEIALKIKAGQKGKDYLSIEGKDDIEGWGTTPLEAAFFAGVQKLDSLDWKLIEGTLRELAQAGTEIAGQETASKFLDGLADVLCALVDASDAVEGMRARLMAYAGDWGSTLSTVGNASNKLYHFFQRFAKTAKPAVRARLATLVGEKYLEMYAKICTWVESDTHAEFYVKVSELVGVESTVELLARDGTRALAREDYDAAKKFFTDAIARDNNNMEAQLGLGKVAIHDHDLKTAHHYLVIVTMYNGSNAEAHRLLIEVKKALGDIQYIENDYRDLLDCVPNDPDALYNLGEINFKNKNYIGARYFFTKLLEVDPRNEKAAKTLAKLPFEKKKD